MATSTSSHVSSFMAVASTSIDQARVSPRVIGGSTISYVYVVAFEASVGGQSMQPRFCDIVCSGFHDTLPIVVCNPKRLHLNSSIVDEISINMDDLLVYVFVFHFKDFWPSLLDLHAWISRVWDPFISKSA